MNQPTLTDEQLDYLREIMSIGSGNVATALSRLLNQAVDLTHSPELRLCPLSEVAALLGPQIDDVVGLRLHLSGDVEGYLFFVVPQADWRHFMTLVQKRIVGAAAKQDLTVLQGIASIVVGNYLSALREFCGLNIAHSKPRVAIGRFRAILSEAIATLADQMPQVILIRNELVIVGDRISMFLLIAPEQKSISTLWRQLSKPERSGRAVTTRTSPNVRKTEDCTGET